MRTSRRSRWADHTEPDERLPDIRPGGSGFDGGDPVPTLDEALILARARRSVRTRSAGAGDAVAGGCRDVGAGCCGRVRLVPSGG